MVQEDATCLRATKPIIAIFFSKYLLYEQNPKVRLHSLTIPNFDYKLQITLLQLAMAKPKKGGEKRRRIKVGWGILELKPDSDLIPNKF